MRQAFLKNVMGHYPDWYKRVIMLFLFINPVVY
ncbi:hypothetical protein F9881_18730, partial [Morganella morganii]|nr:hypothetical protein [Morganella morganii]